MDFIIKVELIVCLAVVFLAVLIFYFLLNLQNGHVARLGLARHDSD